MLIKIKKNGILIYKKFQFRCVLGKMGIKKNKKEGDKATPRGIFNLDKLYYANTRNDAQKIDFDDSFIYEELKKNIKERKIPMIQMMRNEALIAFELWDKKTDKVKY